MRYSNQAPEFVPGFAIDLHRQLARDGGNLAVSPLSAAAILTIALAGARGDTACEIEAVLRLAYRQDDVHAAFPALLQYLPGEGGGEGATLAIANRVWAAADTLLEEAFLALVRECYRSEVGQEDFSDPRRAAGTINAWVEEATRGRIHDIIMESDLSEETTFVLANAIYFLGVWEEPFNHSATLDAAFWLDGSTSVRVAMMSRGCGDVLYAPGDGWEAIELPYRGERLVMDLIKPAVEPHSDPSLGAAVNRLMTQPPRLLQSLEDLEASWSVASLCKMLSLFRPTSLAVWVPRFDIDTSLELSEALSQLGMKKAFRRSEADFSGAVRGKPTWIGLIKQACRLRVDEQGTEAAAATAAGMITGVPSIFAANHPFLFLVRDTHTGAILFTGRVADPTGGSASGAGYVPTATREPPVLVSPEPPRRKPWWRRFW